MATFFFKRIPKYFKSVGPARLLEAVKRIDIRICWKRGLEQTRRVNTGFWKSSMEGIHWEKYAYKLADKPGK